MYDQPTRHPGSKKPSAEHYRAGPPGRKGNTWRAVTRAFRRQPGWRKRAERMGAQ